MICPSCGAFTRPGARFCSNCRAPVEIRVPLLHGRYQIIGPLSKGGFATEFLARDTSHANQLVLVKENLTVADVSSNERKQETEYLRGQADVLRSLRHPGIAQVLDFFEEANKSYWVSDYVQGNTLEVLLRAHGRPLIEAQVLEWGKQICDALSYLHANSVIHRDIKPANIILTSDGRAILIDFGISEIRLSRGVSRSGPRAATPGYSPPEQYSGGTDQRSDIYSLGATLYTLLTAKVPPDTMELVSGTPLASPRIFNPLISTRTEQTILRAMALDPNLRFQAVSDFRVALFGLPQRVHSARISCPTCGFQNNLGAAFCDNCGTSLRDTQSSRSTGSFAPLVAASPPLAPVTSKSIPTEDEISSSQRSHPTNSFQLPLFALAQVDLEGGNHAIVGREYLVRAGIGQTSPEQFQAEPFSLQVSNPIAPVIFEILIHPAQNLEILGDWHKQLAYFPANPTPQLVEFRLRATKEGHGLVSVDFYNERRWLKTIQLKFDFVDDPTKTTTPM